MLAGLFYTFYLIVVDRARRVMKPMPVLAIATTAGALPLLLFALLLGDQVTPHDWAPLVLLALGSQVIGQGLLVYAVGYLSPVVVGLGLGEGMSISAHMAADTAVAFALLALGVALAGAGDSVAGGVLALAAAGELALGVCTRWTRRA